MCGSEQRGSEVCVLTAEAALLFFVMLRVECFSSWAVPRRRAASSAHTQPAGGPPLPGELPQLQGGGSESGQPAAFHGSW